MIDPQKAIHVISTTDGDLRAWVHTSGLRKYGHPELEVRNIPAFLVPAVVEILNDLAEFVLNSDEVRYEDGMTIDLGAARTVIHFEKPTKDINHQFYEGSVLRLVDPPPSTKIQDS